MIYHFRVISNESDDFIFEIAIDSKTLFVDLHNYIQSELDFDKSQITSFFLTDEDWNKEIEITLLDMMVDSEHHKVMDQVMLEDLLTQPKQRLLYTFDIIADRVLFMELIEINQGNLDKPACLRKEGTPPPPFTDDDFSDNNFNVDEEFDSFGMDDEDMDWGNDDHEDYSGEEPDESNYY